MLRYFYLLSFLICINFSLCYMYSSDKASHRRSIMRKSKTDQRNPSENLQYRKHRKRQDYDAYYKDLVAEIDVAGFINSAEDESLSENYLNSLQDKKLRYEKSYNNYDGLSESNNDEDYLDSEAEILHENSDYMNLNPTEDKVIPDKFTHTSDKVLQYNLDNDLNGQNNRFHKGKKCVLKNIKLPFFSHNKSTTDRGKEQKKRKIYGFHKAKKANVNCEGSNENLPKQHDFRVNSNIYKHDKIKKRSYSERLCPACRRKFITSKSINPYKKRNNVLKDAYDSNIIKNKIHLNNYDVDADIIPRNNEQSTLQNFWIGNRRKREFDDRNVERQKELEYLEKRVESVTVNNPTYNKITI